MKIVHGSLRALLHEVKERKVEAVRVAAFLQSDVVSNGMPRYTAWVIVTGVLDGTLWAEWRLLVGRGHAEVTEQGAVAPARLGELLKQRTRKFAPAWPRTGSACATGSSRTTPRRWMERSSDLAGVRHGHPRRNGEHSGGIWRGGESDAAHQDGAAGADRTALMPDLDLIRMLSPLGVGGLLACVIFIYYRLDFLRERQNHQAERERQAKREERLLVVIERNAAASERLAVTIENLARALEREALRP